MASSFTELLRLPEGNAKPTSLPTGATPGFKGGKKAAVKLMAKTGPRLAELQERLYAAGRTGDTRRILLVLQGMDTSGKGGTIQHISTPMSPQGLSMTSFKAPTLEERAHDFLWRVRRALPGSGLIGMFDRSHYEDVLIVRVHEFVPRSTWYSRYESIRNFEADLVEDGVTIIKCFLHVSPETQRERLLARLDDPTKYWKYNPADVDERGFWGEYAAAYDDALAQCSTDAAPWFVIPSDHKWYRNLAVSQLLLEHLESLALGWPRADFDPEDEKLRLRPAPADGSQVAKVTRAATVAKAAKAASTAKAANTLRAAKPTKPVRDAAAVKPAKKRQVSNPKRATRSDGSARAEPVVPPGSNGRPSAALAAKKRRSATPI